MSFVHRHASNEETAVSAPDSTLLASAADARHHIFTAIDIFEIPASLGDAGLYFVRRVQKDDTRIALQADTSVHLEKLAAALLALVCLFANRASCH